MKTARLHRLFNPRTGRCFDVAIDHGFFNEGAFLSGIENLPRAVATLVACYRTEAYATHLLCNRGLACRTGNIVL